ncbi:MAG: alcohol dehydrogenase, partial [Desulfobacterales bacterium]|nr:alcohol dehydrogenase [Desulfobacterales bacterium]
MKAMVLKECCEIKIQSEARKMADLPLKEEPLDMVELPDPVPDSRQILVKISVCGICHTELDEIEG